MNYNDFAASSRREACFVVRDHGGSGSPMSRMKRGGFANSL
jgi:hypothetical protein